MKEIPEYEKDLASIRSMMERSVKFVSLSGLSGVLAGIYALIGAALAYWLLYFPQAPFGFEFNSSPQSDILLQLIIVAAVVLAASLFTGYALSQQKARKLKVSIWSKASQQLLLDLAIPLVAGGLFILILIWRGDYGIVAPASLIFYGLALAHASRNTYREVQFLGFFEIALGLLCALLPGYGLIFWAIGFSLLHIVYGILMHYRYDQ